MAKKATNKKAANKKAAGKKQKKDQRYKAFLDFPVRSLEAALIIPQALRQIDAKKARQGISTDLVSKAVEMNKEDMELLYLTRASSDYWLTDGDSEDSEIRLTELGQKILLARNPETRRKKLFDAFMSVELFKKVFDYYEGSAAIPIEGDSLADFLRDKCKLNKGVYLYEDLLSEFERIFRENCKYLGIENGLSEKAPKARKTKPVAARVADKPKGKGRSTSS